MKNKKLSKRWVLLKKLARQTFSIAKNFGLKIISYDETLVRK